MYRNLIFDLQIRWCLNNLSQNYINTNNEWNDFYLRRLEINGLLHRLSYTVEQYINHEIGVPYFPS